MSRPRDRPAGNRDVEDVIERHGAPAPRSDPPGRRKSSSDHEPARRRRIVDAECGPHLAARRLEVAEPRRGAPRAVACSRLQHDRSPKGGHARARAIQGGTSRKLCHAVVGRIGFGSAREDAGGLPPTVRHTSARSFESNSSTPRFVSITSGPVTPMRPCSETARAEQHPAMQAHLLRSSRRGRRSSPITGAPAEPRLDRSPA